MTLLRSLQALAIWVASPSVFPWVGLLAALAAAMTIDPKTWFKSTRVAGLRALRVAGIWLVLAFCLSQVGRGGWGFGGGKGDDEGSGNGTSPATTTPLLTPDSGQFPSDKALEVVLLIRFVPSASNPEQARPFACDVLERRGGRKTEVRGENMDDFERQLDRCLGSITLPGDLTRPIIQVELTPYPGPTITERLPGRLQARFRAAHIELKG